jgi:hypothetical protein
MVANAFKGSINLMILTVLGSSCNLHPSIFEALIQNKPQSEIQRTFRISA